MHQGSQRAEVNFTTSAPLRVAVIFEPGKQPRPVWFEYKSRKHTVKEITYTWSEEVGSKILKHFTMTDNDSVLFHLAFSPSDGKWVMANLSEVRE